ncbi:MAG: succinylglutamate desuccinylase/aspartoacylase family protein [Candidatus Velthaea sp.]
MNPYAQLEGAWKGLRARGVHVREVACVGKPRTLLLAEIPSSGGRGTISLSAGIHGDEPAAPWALYDLVRSRLLDDRFDYRMWPCLNPEGYAAGTRTSADGTDLNRTFSRGGTSPESRAVITATRDRRFALHMDLHEDPEAHGAYLYEPLAPGAVSQLAQPVIDALDEAGVAIQDLSDPDFDLGSPPAARAVQTIGRGSVVMGAREESVFFAGGLTFSLFQMSRASVRGLTVESAGRRTWDERIATHRIAVTTAIFRLE